MIHMNLFSLFIFGEKLKLRGEKGFHVSFYFIPFFIVGGFIFNPVYVFYFFNFKFQGIKEN